MAFRECRIVPLGVAVVAAFALGACNAEKKLIEEARAQHARGELDKALTSLERVGEQAPGSEQDVEAKALAADWLVAAADAESSPHAARVRLDQALGYDALHGGAQVRVCQLLVDADKLDDADKCLGEQLSDKRDVPKALLDEAEKSLAEKRKRQGAEERNQLLSSPSKHHWEALVKRYPDSTEAKLAKDKIARHGSLCKDLDSFTKLAKDELIRQRDIDDKALAAAAEIADQRKRHAAFAQIGIDSAPRVRELKNAAGAVNIHELEPGEEAAKKPLYDALWSLADSAAVLAEKLERHRLESDESFEEQTARTSRGWRAAFDRIDESVSGQLSDAEKACRSARE